MTTNTPPGQATIRLPFKRSNHSAAVDGMVLWDASLSAPIVSREKAFRRLAVLVDVPATATSAGVAGDYAVDASWLYLCVAANTWARAPVAPW